MVTIGIELYWVLWKTQRENFLAFKNWQHNWRDKTAFLEKLNKDEDHMHSIDILDSGYLEKKDLACSRWVRQFISHFFAHPRHLPSNFIELHWTILVGLCSQRKLHGGWWNRGQFHLLDMWAQKALVYLGYTRSLVAKRTGTGQAGNHLRGSPSSTFRGHSIWQTSLACKRFGGTLYRKMAYHLQLADGSSWQQELVSNE